MKKLILSLVALLIVISMVPAALAAGTPAAALTSGAADPGQAVVLTLSLSGFPQATSALVVVEGLPVLGYTWLRQGALSDFNTDKNQGAWRAEEAMDISGDLLDLAFLVPSDPGDRKEFPVKVTVQLMNGSQVLGLAEATGMVRVRQAATKVTLDQTSLNMDLSAGKTAALQAVLTPANATDSLVWSSSDETVVTVLDGTVTGLKPGTATVTVTAGQVSAQCAVTVTCTHANARKVPAMESNCRVTGHKAHYSCDDCGTLLTGDTKTPTTMAELKLPLGDHKAGTVYNKNEAQHWTPCAICGDPGTTVNHSFTWVTDREPTDTAAGVKHEECVCGQKRSENTPIAQLAHTHRLTHHAAVPATCSKEGTVEHWTCDNSACEGKFYGKEDCSLVLTTVTVAADPDKHTGKTVVKGEKPATCTEAGYTGDLHCQDCGAKVASGKATDKLEHTFVWVTDKYPTCFAAGSKHEECSACKEKRGEAVELAKLTHAPRYVAAKEPTCHEDGNIACFYCPNCGYYADNNGVPGAWLSAKDVILPATDHNVGEDAPWQSDASGHWQVCSCGEKTAVQAHKTVLENAAEATDTAEGYTGDEVCDVCGFLVKKGEAIPVIAPTETTAAPTEAPETTVAPTRPASGDEEPVKGQFPWWILILILAAAVIVTAVMAHKKKK